MAGFSLGRGGGGGGDQEDVDQDQIPLILYGGTSSPANPSTSRGFELWQIQRHQQQHHQFYSAAPTMLGFSSDDQQQAGLGAAGPGGGGRGVLRGSSSSGGGGMSCQDCGNQAKKDCSHMRCRTCCKSRGFPCPTHVKSTWVPAAKRRERQQQLSAAAASGSAGGADVPHHPMMQGREISKRPREISARMTSALAATSSGGMEAVTNFPAEVSSPAVFRCVRVSQLDEGEDEYAYQTAVSIGGHLFRGILYDQGPESQYHQQQHLHGESSSTAATISAATTALTTGTGNVGGSGSVGLIDPSSVYPTPLSTFMAGTQFFPHHPHPRP